MRSAISAFLFFFWVNANASMVTIDFEEFDLGDGPTEYYGGTNWAPSRRVRVIGFLIQRRLARFYCS